MLGHCMGAASALEAIACVMTLETGIYPPTIGYETPDPECDVDVVANARAHGQGRRRPQQLARVRRLQRGHVLREAGQAPRPADSRTREAACDARSPASASSSALGIGREAFFAGAASAERLRAIAATPIDELRRVRSIPTRASSRCRDFDPDEVPRRQGAAHARSADEAARRRGAPRAARRGVQEGRRVRRALARARRRRAARTRTAASRRSPSSIASRSSRTRGTSTPRSSRTRSRTARAGT